jgi:hypothetical protein
VVIAVIAMRMMQMPVHKIVHMITVRNRFMATVRSVDMARLMAPTLVFRRTGIGIRRRYLDHMLIHMITVDMVKMAVMDIVHMTVVLNRRMSATRAVLVRVVFVNRAVACRTHRLVPFKPQWLVLNL